MSPHNLLRGKRLLLTTLALTGAIVRHASAGQNLSAPPQPQALEITAQAGEVIGNEQVIRCFIKCGTNQFLFVVPPGLRSEIDQPENLLLESKDGRFYLKFRLLRESSTDPDLKQSPKDRVLTNYPGATKTEDFTTIVTGVEGQGLHFLYRDARIGDRLVRCVWVPVHAGTLEFTLDTGLQQAPAAKGAMETVLLTFRSNEQGKLEIVRRSDKS
jgi:hypothetical protein